MRKYEKIPYEDLQKLVTICDFIDDLTYITNIKLDPKLIKAYDEIWDSVSDELWERANVQKTRKKTKKA